MRRDRDSNPGIPKDDSLAGCCITTLPPLLKTINASFKIADLANKNDFIV